MTEVELENRATFYMVLDKWIKEAIEFKRKGLIKDLDQWYKPLLETYFDMEKQDNGK